MGIVWAKASFKATTKLKRMFIVDASPVIVCSKLMFQKQYFCKGQFGNNKSMIVTGFQEWTVSIP
jgi:hypothetical protein